MKSAASACGRMARLPCTLPGARPAVGPRCVPALTARRAESPLPGSGWSFRRGIAINCPVSVAASLPPADVSFERTCSIREQFIRACDWRSINTDIAVESYCRIAFANGNKEPAKVERGGLAMPRHAIRHRRVVNALTVAFDACRGVGVRSTLFQFDVLICGPSRKGALAGRHQSDLEGGC